MRNEKIRKVLEKDENEEIDIEDSFKELKISNYVKEKGKAYAKLITELLKQPVECAGFLTAPRDDNAFPKDIFLAYDQHVQNAKVRVSAEGINKSGNDIKKNNNLSLGIFHSHADFNPFLSPIDDVNFNMLKGVIYLNNKKMVSSDRIIFAKGPFKLDYHLNDRKDPFYEIISNDIPPKKFYMEVEEFIKKSDLKIKKLEVVDPIYVNYAISMIVNAIDSEPYFYIGVQDPKTKEEIFLDSKKDFDVDYVKQDKQKVDYDKIEEELVNRVYFNGELLKDILSKKIIAVENRFKNKSVKEDLEKVIDVKEEKTKKRKEPKEESNEVYLFSDEDFNREMNFYKRKLENIFGTQFSKEKIEPLKDTYNSLKAYKKEIESIDEENKEKYLSRIDNLFDEINENKENIINKLEVKIRGCINKLSNTDDLIEKYSSGFLVLNRSKRIIGEKENKYSLEEKLSELKPLCHFLKYLGGQNTEYNNR